MEIHSVRKAEYAAFLRLWQTCFGDSRDVVEEFCGSFGSELTPFVLTEDGVVRSALTWFPMGTLAGPEDTPGLGRPVWCSYAIATDPAARGKGYGSAITKWAAERAMTKGFLSVLSPADAGLVQFYRPIGYTPYFLAAEHTVRAAADASSAAGPAPFRLVKAAPAAYGTARERALADRPHLRLTRAVLEYADRCGPEGKGLFFLEAGGQSGLVALEDTGDPAEMKAVEFLWPGDPAEPARAAAGAAAVLGAQQILYRTPADPGDPDHYVQAMLYCGNAGGASSVSAVHSSSGTGNGTAAGSAAGGGDGPADENGTGKAGWFGFPFE